MEQAEQQNSNNSYNGKSLNQIWKDNGKPMPFKDYAKRFDRMKRYFNASGSNAAEGVDNSNLPMMDDSKVFGIKKSSLYIASGILILAGTIYFMKKRA